GRNKELLESDFPLRLLHEALGERHLAHAISALDPVAFANERITGKLTSNIKRYRLELPCPIKPGQISPGISSQFALVRTTDFKTRGWKEQTNASASRPI